MKEKDFLKTIKDTLNSKYIGDDCAYLKDLGIVITQDSLVEDVHFSREFSTPYQLGYKSVTVNISDICASGAKPAYLTIALSLPEITDNNFVKKFYEGAKDAAKDVEIVGGDITGSDKIYISVTAIGTTKGRNISSRSNALVGQKIVIAGEHGSSAAGLNLLRSYSKMYDKFKTAHLYPWAQRQASELISTNVKTKYAMMDTSDGLMDALSQIAEMSNVKLKIDYDKIPYDEDLKNFQNFTDLIFFGGEDYGLVATVPEKLADKLTVIGEVVEGEGVEINFGKIIKVFSREYVEERIYNHFADSDAPLAK